MTRDDVKRRSAEGVVFGTQVMANPANTREWIVMFKKDAGRSFFLVNEQEEVDSFASLDGLVEQLRQLGIRRSEIQL